MTAKQGAALGAWIISLAGILGAFGHWHWPTPSEAAAILASFGAFVIALYAERPGA